MADDHAKLTTGMLGFVGEGAMRKFEERPSREEFQEALADEAKKLGGQYPVVGFASLEAFQSLDRHEGHLLPWSTRVVRQTNSKAEPKGSSQTPDDGETES